MLAKCRLKALALELWEEPGPCAFYFLTLFHFYMLYNYGSRVGRVDSAAAVTIRYWWFSAWQIHPLESDHRVAIHSGPLPRDG